MSLPFVLEPWHWLALGVVLAGLEIVLPGAVLIWFGAAAVCTSGLLWLLPALGLPAQLGVFAVLAVAWLGGSGDYFNLSGTEYGGWTLIGRAQLELTGQLTVAISSLLGDFYLGSSRLTVQGVRAVPEPGMLALFGAGLLGLGLVRRKRASV